MNSKFIFFILSLLTLIVSFYLIKNEEFLTISWILFYISALILIISVIKLFIKESPHSSYEGIEKLYLENGIFTFEKGRFYLNQNNKIEKIEWKEVREIIIYKTPIFDNLIFNMEIYTSTKAFKFTDETKGWYKLTHEINQNLNVIDQNWNIINYTIHNNERKIIYKKKDSGCR